MQLASILAVASFLFGLLHAAPAPVQMVARAPLPSPTGIPMTSTAQTELQGLVVAPTGSEDGYSRAKFPHWITQNGTCNTREVVLKRDGTSVLQNTQCQATSGTWLSPYEGQIETDAAKIQIDHMVPLANAWRSGASAWTTEQRQIFANDLIHPQLWAVSGTINDKKSDSSPDKWKPPLNSFYCTYAEAWVAVKSTYNLTVTSAEKTALAEMLATC